MQSPRSPVSIWIWLYSSLSDRHWIRLKARLYDNWNSPERCKLWKDRSVKDIKVANAKIWLLFAELAFSHQGTEQIREELNLRWQSICSDDLRSAKLAVESALSAKCFRKRVVLASWHQSVATVSITANREKMTKNAEWKSFHKNALAPIEGALLSSGPETTETLEIFVY